MSFGIPTRNGLSLGLGAVPTLATNFGLPIPSLSLDYTIPSDGTPGVVPGFYQVDNGFGVLTQTTFSSLITFSRASNATRFSPTGQLEYAPHNLLLQSQTFDNASWTKSNSSITANAATAPDGTITADKEIPANGVAGTYIAQGFSATSGTTYTYTVYAKASEFSELRLLGESGAFGSNTTGVYNLSTGVASVAAGSPTVSMTSVGNGWWRCVWTATATATTTGSVQQRINTTGDGTSGLFIWGAQLSVGPNALDYTPTTTAVVYGPRFDYNPSTLVAQGLLIEEQRTNSIRNNTMVGAVAGTPGTLPTNWQVSVAAGLTTNVIGTGTSGGVTYIDLQITGTSNATSYILGFDTTTQIAASAGQTWAWASWVAFVSGSLSNVTTVSADFRESNSGGTQLAAGAVALSTLTSSLVRQSATRTLSEATTAFVQPRLRLTITNGAAIDITLRIGLPQLEQGAFATSVIPTTTAATTRSADIASIGTLSPWYNATEGTLYAEAQIATGIGATPAAVASLDNTTTSNRIQLRRASPGTLASFRMVSSAGSIDVTLTSGTLTGVNKIAAAFAASNQNAVNNGILFTGITSIASLPTVTRLLLGDGPGSSPLNGYLRRITYTPRRLTNAELQSLTS
jgi:hypothetical protein